MLLKCSESWGGWGGLWSLVFGPEPNQIPNPKFQIPKPKPKPKPKAQSPEPRDLCSRRAGAEAGEHAAPLGGIGGYL
jgi:hypothetical protein